MYFEDLQPLTGWDPSAIAIGWLHNDREYPRGGLPTELLEALKAQPTTRQTRGIHKCPFCGDATSSNEIHIDSGGKRYASPRMIVHYIEKHDYRPPDEYVTALENLLTTDTVYESVVSKIEDKTVTVSDFNILIEATDKSARDRVHSRVRPDHEEPGSRNTIARLVPRKHGRNDPPRQGRGRRYAAGTPAKERQNHDQRVERHKLENKLAESIGIILKRNGSDPAVMIEDIGAGIIRAVVPALLRSELPDKVVNSDWLYLLLNAAEQASGSDVVPSMKLTVKYR